MPDQKTKTKAKERSSHPMYLDEESRPAWEVAYLFPAQGQWTEQDYFDLEEIGHFKPRLELSNGRLEVLTMPTELHQLIVAYLLDLLKAFTQTHAPGMVLFTGLRVRLWKRTFREPDVIYMKAEHAHRRHNEYWEGADLVMEVVSPDPKDRERDLRIKVRQYARAGIPEYWIIDPQERLIRVLTLVGKAYKLHGKFTPGMEATSALLPGFAVSVDLALAPPGS
jgi:Uma2 family endonuclease